ncbi:MAG: 3-methylornithyl-N6-L-lysine dehydrogenase PylD [Eubacteriales bacterium]
MTRLYYEIIRDIPFSLSELDIRLQQSTGCDLMNLAALTANLPPAAVATKLGNCSAAVVPITSGEGVITGFANAVAAVLQHIGLQAGITRQYDVAGFGEAFGSKFDVVFAADDHKFLAFNLKTLKVVDNAQATAVGFVRALAATAELKSGGLYNREVLVLGLGPVGVYAVKELKKLGADIWVFDTDTARMEEFAGQYVGVKAARGIGEAIKGIDYVLDATPAAGIIGAEMIGPATVISCPGVPHGLTPEAGEKIGSRFIHDNLALGVATMAVQSILAAGIDS